MGNIPYCQVCISAKMNVGEIPVNEEKHQLNERGLTEQSINQPPLIISTEHKESVKPQLNNGFHKDIISTGKLDINTNNTRNSTSIAGKNKQSLPPNSFCKKMRGLEFKSDKIYSKTAEFYLNNLHLSGNKVNLSRIVGSPKGDNINSLQLLNTNKQIEDSICVEELPFNFMDHYLLPEDEINIIKLLKTIFVFKEMSQDVLSLIINEMMFLVLPKDKIVYTEGDDGNFFYIIYKGTAEVTESKKTEKKFLGHLDSFGELSLLTQKRREDTITTTNGNVEFFVLEGESFRDIQKRTIEVILKERFNFLNNIAIFESLDKISKYNVTQKLNKVEFESGEVIIYKGDVGDKLYIIKEGLVSCRIGVKEIRKLGNKEYFGQNAILIDVKRGCDIVALQHCVCYELSREDLKEALSNDYIDIILFCFFKNSIDNNENLKSFFIESFMHEIFKSFSIRIYSKKDQIYSSKSSDPLKSNNKKLVIVIEGSLFRGSQLMADKGKILGEEMFKDYSKSITEDIIAYPDCITLEATIPDIAKILKIDLNQEKPLNILSGINKLKKLYLFKNLSEKTLEAIAKNMVKEKFKPGEIIVQEGTPGDKFFLISKGKVKITKEGKFIRELESGACLGESVLLSENELRTASAIAIDKVICFVIYKKEFDLILTDKNTKNYLLKKLALQDTTIKLSDLQYIKFLGKGKFGSVSLVHNHKNVYAIKAISRKSVEREKILAKYFVNERKIMLSLDHPFIVKLVKSMKNQHFCFLLIEFVNGKNLDEYLSLRMHKKNIYETQFYIGSILLMVDYLQKKFIAHRDIKPSNIMIDSNGYLKMIDFGTAKILTDYTSTIIGTPHYIAPEILQGKGYSLSCDYWSIGICMYEIFYAMYPFGHYANEVIEIYKDILNKEFAFPSENSKYIHVNNLISNLLTKKVNQRICNFNQIKKKPFFDEFEFDKLQDFKMEPPYIPPTNDITKHLNENNPYEALVQEDNTVSGKKQKNNDYVSGYNPNWADEF